MELFFYCFGWIAGALTVYGLMNQKTLLDRKKVKVKDLYPDKK